MLPLARRRWFAPEVVQTSAMDCGPAALKCLLDGHGIRVSYGRLREACQTDVDGTSIDTLEEIACRLGLDAEQVLMPANRVLLPEAKALPALTVVTLPNGFTHFVIAWRRHGKQMQVMDPGVGRRRVPAQQFLDELYTHPYFVPARRGKIVQSFLADTDAVLDEEFDWDAAAHDPRFCATLKHQLKHLGANHRTTLGLIGDAVSRDDWQPLASLDAAVRLTESLVRSGGLKRGKAAVRFVSTLVEQIRSHEAPPNEIIPSKFWAVTPGPPTEDGTGQVVLHGAVLVRISGRAEESADDRVNTSELNTELQAAVTERPPSPIRHVARMLSGDGLLPLFVLLVGLLLAAGSVVLEAALLRSAIHIGEDLGLVEQRLGAIGLMLVFVFALLLIELRVAGGLLRLGRLLENRLRIEFLQKIPLLNDRYFQSRPVSDMAERAHATHEVRHLPWLGGQMIRALATLVVTIAAIIWLDPPSWALAVLAAVVVVGVPLWRKRRLEELDLRVRTHAGGLSRFYLDALLGLVPIRAHAAERSVRREHESLLVDWAAASLERLRAVTRMEFWQALAGFGFAVALVWLHFVRGAGETAGSLLLAYWALQLPTLGEQLATLVSQSPLYRNTLLRLLEPLGAPEEKRGRGGAGERGSRRVLPPLGALDEELLSSRSVAIRFDNVTVRAAGQTILESLDLDIPAGSHVAIVGPSGAGKSSLVGVLLGWHRPASGCVEIDGEPLDAERLEQLRRETAWVDPAVQLWNRTLLGNLWYGSEADQRREFAEVLESSDLHDVLHRLPDGLKTPLGDGGGLLSGGEGQRVRLGRAAVCPEPRLVILDEPFRGLDRHTRTKLLAHARRVWRNATLLCITHDVACTGEFERTLVIDEGRLVEDFATSQKERAAKSRYEQLRRSDAAVMNGLWTRNSWQRIELQAGHLANGEAEGRR